MRPEEASSRAWSSSGGRSRLPTWSARNGGAVRAVVCVSSAPVVPPYRGRVPTSGDVVGRAALRLLPRGFLPAHVDGVLLRGRDRIGARDSAQRWVLLVNALGHFPNRHAAKLEASCLDLKFLQTDHPTPPRTPTTSSRAHARAHEGGCTGRPPPPSRRPARECPPLPLACTRAQATTRVLRYPPMTFVVVGLGHVAARSACLSPRVSVTKTTAPRRYAVGSQTAHNL
jgi:hypothetical protein